MLVAVAEAVRLVVFEIVYQLDVCVPVSADERHIGVALVMLLVQQLETELLSVERDRLVHVVDEDRRVKISRHALDSYFFLFFLLRRFAGLARTDSSQR